MRASVILVGFLAVAIAGFSPASAPNSAYRAVPQTAPADGRIIVYDIAWRCFGGTCFAPRTGSSTDTTICSALARNLGPLASFSVGVATFDAQGLEQCNRSYQPRR